VAARGWQLTIPVDPDDVPEDADEFYDHQLVGLAVEDPAGARLGTVTGIQHGGAQDLLVLDVDGREVLFPFVAALVPSVDVPGGRLVVDDQPGLLVEESP
jgi:16S rRNA processing protein RimM